jgi:transposase-like protein
VVAKPKSKGTAVRNSARKLADDRVGSVAVQIPLPLLDALGAAENAFFSLCLNAGREVLTAMMEQDRTELCGPKGKRLGERAAVRAGSAPSEVTLGGRRIPMRRLRARSIEGRELALGSFQFASNRDPLDRFTLATISRGVSTRGYQEVLEELPTGEAERSVSRTTVSRRFAALSSERLRELLSRPLAGLDLRVVLIDGIVFHDHTVLIALGVAADGRKHVLGLREGATENATVARALIADLIERGLPTDRAVLFVVDGSKALSKAITEIFGPLALIQRCQVHKMRNVLEHLPEAARPRVRRLMRDAWRLGNAKQAERKLRALAGGLERDHPGAAKSLGEGLLETLTLQRLGVGGALYQTLRTTNPIENLNGRINAFTRNVTHWRDGAMLVRWLGAAVLRAEAGFRRLRGHRDRISLVATLDRTIKTKSLDLSREAA